MKELWVYQSRQGYIDLFNDFADARRRQDEDNGCSVDDCRENNLEVEGSEDEGYFYIDDGGSITLTAVN